MRLKLGVLVGVLTVLALAGGGSAAAASDDGGPSRNRPSHSTSSEPGGQVATIGIAADAPFTQKQAERFAKCMRANGVPGLKTPKVREGRIESTVPKGVDREVVRKATEKCAPVAPGKPRLSKAEVKKLKQYAKCMRENGVENFPSPRADGSLQIPDGIDPESADFQAAEEACAKYAPAGRAKKEFHSSGGEPVLHTVTAPGGAGA